jgi:hypothetical protein
MFASLSLSICCTPQSKQELGVMSWNLRSRIWYLGQPSIDDYTSNMTFFFCRTVLRTPYEPNGLIGLE